MPDAIDTQHCATPTGVMSGLKQFLDGLAWLPKNYQLVPVTQQATNVAFELILAEPTSTSNFSHLVSHSGHLNQPQNNQPQQKPSNGKKQQRYLVKYLGQTEFMPLDRQQSLHLQKQLADRGMATEPVVLSNDQCYLIEHWQPRDDQMLRCELIDKLGQLMADIHYLNVGEDKLHCPELALVEHWHGYLALIDSQQRASFSQRIEQLTPVWQATALNRLCHHDLAFQHIASLQNNIVYDWEYGAISCPFFDLANAIQVNELKPAEQQRLLQQYHQRYHQQIQASTAHAANAIVMNLTALCEAVASMQPLAQLTSDLWWAVYQQYPENQYQGQ